MTLMYDLGMSTVQYQPLLRRARLKHVKGVEKWRKEIFDHLKAEGKIPSNVAGLPTPAVVAIRDAALPSLMEIGISLLLHLLSHCVFVNLSIN